MTRVALFAFLTSQPGACPARPREGTLYCGLHARPFPNPELRADTDAPAASPIFSGRKAEFALGNFECTLYPEGEETETQVAPLRGAFLGVGAQPVSA